MLAPPMLCIVFETVLTHFVNATHNFGVPSHVHSDRGGESAQVWHSNLR